MLFGRDEEVDRLGSFVNDMLHGKGHLQFIQLDGEIGVGKSALLSMVVNQLGTADRARSTAGSGSRPRLRIVRCQADPLPRGAPLSAFRAFVEDLLGDTVEQLLDTRTPALLAWNCLEALGEAHLLIALDDAQWLDPASVTFLQTLMQQLTYATLTVFAVHRIGLDPKELIRTARQQGARHIHYTLEALDDEAIDCLAAELPAGQRAAVVEVSQGNPLFAHAVIAAFHRHPQAAKVEDVLKRAHESRTATLASAVAAELQRLTAPALRTLEALAVMGTSDTRKISEITGLDHEQVRSSAKELGARGLLAGSPHEALHPVVRFSVYQLIDAHRRAEVHRRAAHLPDTRLFDRADHLAGVVNNTRPPSESEPPLTEAEVALLEEASSVAIGSEPAAVITWLDDLPPPLRTPRTQTLVARAMIVVGDLEPALERLHRLVESTQSTETRLLLANALRIAGEEQEARAILAAADHEAQEAEPELLREYIDILALIDGRAPEKLLSRLESMPAHDSSSRELNRAIAAVYRTMTLLSEGRVPQARATFRRVTGWLTTVTATQLARVLHACACAVWAAFILEQYEDGAKLADRALLLARRHGQADTFANLGTGLAFCRASLGMLDEADQAGEQALYDAEGYGPPALIGMARAGLAIGAQSRNDPELLQRRFDELVAAPTPEFGWWRRAVLTTRARLSAILGRPESFPELLGEPKDAMAALRRADAAAVAAAGGDLQAANLLLAEGLQIAEEQELDGQRAIILTTRAELLLKMRSPLEAQTLLRTASALFEQQGMRSQLGRARAGIARAQTALVERAERITQLTEREREVAELLSQGLKNREIAAQLTVSTSTAENHVRKVLLKLGLNSRTEIARVLPPLSRLDSA